MFHSFLRVCVEYFNKFYLIVLSKGEYALCDFVACNKSHAINRVVYHRYLRRFLSREINRME